MPRLVPTLVVLTFMLVSVPAQAGAQPVPPSVELFAGYSLLPAGGDDFPRVTSHGLQVGVAFNLTRWFGVAGEFGQQWSRTSDLGPNFAGLTARTTVREYLVGPRFSGRGARAEAFVHAWVGGATGDADGTFSGFSDSGLAVGGGGGFDVRLGRGMSWRTQFDYVGSFADIVENNTRFATGLAIAIR